jgi:type IV secretory pathway VirB10-like protein
MRRDLREAWLNRRQILDKFLNILPTVTIREGHRVKVYLSGDLACPTTTITNAFRFVKARKDRSP